MKLPEIHIIHYDKLVERRAHMEEQLMREGLTAKWFVQKGDNCYADEESKYYKYDKILWIEKIRVAQLSRIPRPLGKNEINLTINHFKLLKYIAESKHNLSLIMEDDVILCNNFTLRLVKILSLLELSDWDLCFLDWCHTTPPRSEGVIEIVTERKKEDFDSWGLGAYLIKSESAKRLLNNFNCFTLVSDDEIRYLAIKNKLSTQWSLPPLTRQGSIYGKFASTLADNREKTGAKRYFFWRKKIYSYLRKTHLGGVAVSLEKVESHIRRRLFGL